MNFLKRLFGRKNYLSKGNKRRLERSTEKRVRKNIDKDIKQKRKEALEDISSLKQIRVELEVLNEVLSEDPNYYSVEEIEKILSFSLNEID